MRLSTRLALFSVTSCLALGAFARMSVETTLARAERERTTKNLALSREAGVALEAERAARRESELTLWSGMSELQTALASRNDPEVLGMLESRRVKLGLELAVVQIVYADSIEKLFGRDIDSGIRYWIAKSKDVGQAVFGYLREEDGVRSVTVVPFELAAGAGKGWILATEKIDADRLKVMAERIKAEVALVADVSGVPNLLARTSENAEKGGISIALAGPMGEPAARMVLAEPAREGDSPMREIDLRIAGCVTLFVLFSVLISKFLAASRTRSLAQLAEALKKADPSRSESLREVGGAIELFGADDEARRAVEGFTEILDAMERERERYQDGTVHLVRDLEAQLERLNTENRKLAQAQRQLEDVAEAA